MFCPRPGKKLCQLPNLGTNHKACLMIWIWSLERLREELAWNFNHCYPISNSSILANRIHMQGTIFALSPVLQTTIGCCRFPLLDRNLGSTDKAENIWAAECVLVVHDGDRHYPVLCSMFGADKTGITLFCLGVVLPLPSIKISIRQQTTGSAMH